MLFELHRTAKEYNKSMTINKELIRCKLSLKDQPIEQVMSDEWIPMNNGFNIYEELKTQANKAARVFGCLWNTICRNKYMSITSKARLYKTAVRPVLICSENKSRYQPNETSTINDRNERLPAITGVTLRDSWRKKWREHVVGWRTID